MSKLYCFYVIPELEERYLNDPENRPIYAYTERKEYARAFYSQRNQKAILKKTFRIEDPESEEMKQFRYDYRFQKIQEIPLCDGKGHTVTLMGTDDEEQHLDDGFDTICCQVDYILQAMDTWFQYGLVKSSIVQHTTQRLKYWQNGNYKGEFSSDFSMNTFRLFQLLHYDLFMDRSVWEYMEALVQKIGCW